MLNQLPKHFCLLATKSQRHFRTKLGPLLIHTFVKTENNLKLINIKEGLDRRDVLTVRNQLSSELDARISTEGAIEPVPEHLLALRAVLDANLHGVADCC